VRKSGRCIPRSTRDGERVGVAHDSDQAVEQIVMAANEVVEGVDGVKVGTVSGLHVADHRAAV
jgi:hypothetical protein